MEEQENGTPLAGDDMPMSLWSVSNGFVPDPHLQNLHANIMLRLRQENPEADILEMLLMERVAAGFIFMRSKEAMGEMSGNEYKNLQQQWVSMAADLRKTRTSNTDIAAVKDELTQSFMDAFEKSIEGLNLDMSVAIRTKMVEALAS